MKNVPALICVQYQSDSYLLDAADHIQTATSEMNIMTVKPCLLAIKRSLILPNCITATKW